MELQKLVEELIRRACSVFSPLPQRFILLPWGLPFANGEGSGKGVSMDFVEVATLVVDEVVVLAAQVISASAKFSSS